MSTTTQKKNQKKNIIIWVGLLIAVICFCVSAGIVLFRQNTPVLIRGGGAATENAAAEENSDSIAVPGYEGLTLKANSLQQDIALRNPPQNTCFFVISLYLEDGTLLWESDYIMPGSDSEQIVLTQELPQGTYPNAVLKYSCFKMDKTKTPLNSAETKLTLRAK